MEIRTRFAPSPTGYLHIGGLRTALYCYAWAKQNKGRFLLRIEDTDRQRLVEGAIGQITQSLDWAELAPDEGVVGFENGKAIEKGSLGPYIQSERLDLYKLHAEELLNAGKAYKCWCTPERLDEMRVAQRAAKQTPKYDRACLHLSEAEKASNEGKSYVLRFFVPEGSSVTWDDVVFDKMEFDRSQVDDFVMIKADGYPTYNFANVVDDHLMQITHVVRGQEFLSSTPKHVIVYQAFGWSVPAMVHVPWILGKNKQKLSKREGDVAVDEYIKKGFLKDALLNYLALLGWSAKDDQDIFSLEEMIKKFRLEDIQKSGAVFDMEKLEWMNSQYIMKLEPEKFLELAMPFIAELIEPSADNFKNLLDGSTLARDRLLAILKTEQVRTRRLDELPEKIRFFLEPELKFDSSIMVWKKMSAEDLPAILGHAKEALSNLDDWSEEGIQSALQELTKKLEKKTGEVFWPVRVALSGKEASPGPQEIGAALGKEKTLARIEDAIARL